MNKRHYLFRPPEEAVDVHRWTGEDWIPDDGKPGLAFSGLGSSKHKYPAAFHPKCGHCLHYRCPTIICQKYTVLRYGCSNSRPILSEAMLLAQARRKATIAQKAHRRLEVREFNNGRKTALEQWLRSIGIGDSLTLTGTKLITSLDVLEELKHLIDNK